MNVEQHLPLVRHVARAMNVTSEDALTEGVLGLLDAARKYDGGAVRFTTYAQHRIRGAIRDHLRRESGGRSRWRATEFVDLVHEDGEERYADPRSDPLAELLACERRDIVARAVAQLPHRDQTLVALYYGCESTLREIGLAFGVTESRASVLRTDVLARLAVLLAPLGGEG